MPLIRQLQIQNVLQQQVKEKIFLTCLKAKLDMLKKCEAVSDSGKNTPCNFQAKLLPPEKAAKTWIVPLQEDDKMKII